MTSPVVPPDSFNSRVPSTANTNKHTHQLLVNARRNNKPVTVMDLLKAAKLDQKGIIRPKIGDMVIFTYSAKHNATLPYWDKFPLIFITDIGTDSFRGINLHYLPPNYRAKLIVKLLDLTNNDRYDESTRLQISYQYLNSAMRFREFKPCFKMYLKTQMVSQFVKIHPIDWDVVTMMPLARFQKQSASQVYKDTRQKIRQYGGVR
jgi:hypothetical protein